MKQTIGALTLLVPDYDEAIDFFTRRLRFRLVTDQPRENGKRWVVVAPPGSVETGLLLARAAGEAQAAHIGRQGGGRVFLFLHTDDFWRDYRALHDAGIEFCEAPRVEPYGTVAVFRDLWGNRWDLIEPSGR